MGLATDPQGLVWPGHRFICGRTGSGKTFYVLGEARRHGPPLLYVDPQGRRADEKPLPWPRATRRDSTELVLRAAARTGCHYVTSDDDEVARAELAVLATALMRRDWKPGVLVVVDEAHLFAPQGSVRGGLLRLARRGRVHGITLAVVSQRPADVAKSVVTQCVAHAIFATSFEGPYFSRYGIDGEQVRRLIEQGGEFSYITWDGAELLGPLCEKA